MSASRIGLGSLLLGCVTWLWLAAPVHAYEDQLSLGVGAGYAYLAHSGGAQHGVAFDLEALTVVTKLNGAVRQSGHVKDMVFPIAELVSFMSHVMTLEPGDLISTGTPEGVGPIARGELVEIEVAGMTLSNRFV